MGAIFCFKLSNDSNKENENVNNTTTNAPKVYSWDKRDKKDISKYTIKDLESATVGRIPYEINGEQFIIDNCQNCKICLFDFIGSLTIDNCKNCQFIIGPVKSSVFIRNCLNCELIVACQQFRTRDCDKLTCFLACATVPVIENTSKFKVAPLQLYYKQMQEQFALANLSPFNCNWSEIHDFTPLAEGHLNFHLLNKDIKPLDLIKVDQSTSIIDQTDAQGDSVVEDNQQRKFIDFLVNQSQLNDSPMQSIVPYTRSNKISPSVQNAPISLVIVLADAGTQQQISLAQQLSRFVIHNIPQATLIRTQHLKISHDMATNIFGSNISENHSSIIDGIIYMEYCGQVIDQIRSYLDEHRDVSDLVYLTSDESDAESKIEMLHRQFKSGMDLSH